MHDHDSRRDFQRGQASRRCLLCIRPPSPQQPVGTQLSEQFVQIVQGLLGLYHEQRQALRRVRQALVRRGNSGVVRRRSVSTSCNDASVACKRCVSWGRLSEDLCSAVVKAVIWRAANQPPQTHSAHAHCPRRDCRKLYEGIRARIEQRRL